MVITVFIICYFLIRTSGYTNPYTLLIAFVLLSVFGQLCVWEGRWIQSVLKEDEPLG